ncbi:hypothetical protein EOM09_05685 [bacterium]|nr:hypothetical protein [bacterium]
MRIDYLMQQNIFVHEGYTKTQNGNTIIITHNSSGKILLTVNEHLRIYRMHKNKIFKLKTSLQIEKYFYEIGYKKL